MIYGFMKPVPGPISPTFYVKLLHAEIPKVQNYSQTISLFALFESGRVKALRKHVDEIDTRSLCPYFASKRQTTVTLS